MLVLPPREGPLGGARRGVLGNQPREGPRGPRRARKAHGHDELPAGARRRRARRRLRGAAGRRRQRSPGRAARALKRKLRAHAHGAASPDSDAPKRSCAVSDRAKVRSLLALPLSESSVVNVTATAAVSPAPALESGVARGEPCGSEPDSWAKYWNTGVPPAGPMPFASVVVVPVFENSHSGAGLWPVSGYELSVRTPFASVIS